MKKIYMLDGLECANCAAKMEKAIGELEGVHSASVSFLTTKLVLEVDEDKIPAVEKAALKIIRKLEPDTKLRAV
ncbi:MAG: cation transporter [Clostridia bacterium]|nr:cation transporter [Clostridia bacterium]